MKYQKNKENKEKNTREIICIMVVECYKDHQERSEMSLGEKTRQKYVIKGKI